jgi:hypothetical protein
MIRKAGNEHGSGLGTVRSVVECVLEHLLRYKRLDRRQDRSSTIIRSLFAAASSSWPKRQLIYENLT